MSYYVDRSSEQGEKAEVSHLRCMRVGPRATGPRSHLTLQRARTGGHLLVRLQHARRLALAALLVAVMGRGHGLCLRLCSVRFASASWRMQVSTDTSSCWPLTGTATSSGQ